MLFGWSMGAAIALKLADRPRHEGLIAALVLDSPVLDWTEVIKTNCTRSRVPAAAGHLALPWLTIEPLARLAGLPGRIPLRSFDWNTRAADLTTPPSSSTALTTTPYRSSSHKPSETPARTSSSWRPSTPTTHSPGTPTPTDGRGR